MVGDVGLALQRDGNDFDGLVVVERLQDELVKLFDRHRRLDQLGGLIGAVGQVLSWSMVARRYAAALGDRGFGGASWGQARAGSWTMSDRAAGEAAKSPVHSNPSNVSPGCEGGRTVAASPSRVPRGPVHHNRAGR
jgi:hypothetical protein